SVRDPCDELIDALFKAASAPREKAELEVWCEALSCGPQDEDGHRLKQAITDNYMSVADLLEAFPSAKLGLEQLIELLPKQKPRLSPISSSPLVHSDQIHVTVGVVQVVSDAGKTRQGLCSNYLAGLDPEQGVTARIAVRPSHFRPPQELEAPILMVG